MTENTPCRRCWDEINLCDGIFIGKPIVLGDIFYDVLQYRLKLLAEAQSNEDNSTKG